VNNSFNPLTRTVQTHAGAQSSWHDPFSIQSSTASVGTPVDVRVNVVIGITAFNTHVISDFDPFARVTGQVNFSTSYLPGNNVDLCFDSWGTACSGPGGLNVGLNEFSFDVQFRVGDAFTWSSLFTAEAQVSTNSFSSFLGSGTVEISALNSADTYFTVLTPGATMVWASGHNYSLLTPVPEPASYAMMIAGLAFVGWARRRATSQGVMQQIA